MRERWLVVNADDFGLSPGISRGIIEAHQSGVVTSTSVMVTFDDWADTAVRLRNAPRSLGIGLHFDLLAGSPAVAVSPIANRASGRFEGVGALLRGIASGRVKADDVQAECEAQIRSLQAVLSESGAALTHLDSHRHVHTLPVVATGVLRAARNMGISIVRAPRESSTARGTIGGRARRALLRMLTPAPASAIAFIGTAFQGDGRFAEHLDSVPSLIGPGATELMCHPGYVDALLVARDHFTEAREPELRALCRADLREAWQTAGISLVNFSGLPGRDRVAE